MPRRPFDFYETPPHYIAALLGSVNVWGRVVEPCVGDGAIASALRTISAVRDVVTNDLDRKRKADYHYDAKDATLYETYQKKAFDWAVTNPTFSEELPILEQALDHVPNVAFLARLSFLEPTKDRAYLLESRPPHHVIVLPRYSFRVNDDGKRQTDNVTCAWLVWGGCQPGVTVWGRAKSQAYAVMKGLS